MKYTLADIKTDIDILSGETVGPTDATWQDVAGTCAVNLRHLATLMDLAREGKAESFTTFPAWPTLGAGVAHTWRVITAADADWWATLTVSPALRKGKYV